MAPVAAILDTRTEGFLAILNLCVTLMPLCHCDVAILDTGTELF